MAHCESSGRWHINTGNGYYGGLQISPRTWRAFGGKRFAHLPHRATKAEQIRVGERIKQRPGLGRVAALLTGHRPPLTRRAHRQVG